MTYLINTKDFSEDFFKEVYKCEKAILPESLKRTEKNDSLLGRVLLGYALKKDYGIEAFSLKYGENEKPYLKEHSVFFNISHSGDYVICSLSQSEIGCDVQTVGEYKEKIAKRYFTDKEKEILDKSENPNEDFTKLWTLKESVLKKTGEGISGGLSSFCFADCLHKNSFIKFGYHFKVSRCIGAYISVCCETPENCITEVNKEELQNYMDSILKGELYGNN